MNAAMPKAGEFDPSLVGKFTYAEEVIIAIRNMRKEKNISFKEPIRVFIKKNYNEKPDTFFDPVVSKLCNISELGYTDEKIADTLSLIIRNTEFYIPLTNAIDKESEISRLESELAYASGFLESVMKKLGNPKFVDGAPAAVVESERRKKADAESKIAVIKAQIESLKG